MKEKQTSLHKLSVGRVIALSLKGKLFYQGAFEEIHKLIENENHIKSKHTCSGYNNRKNKQVNTPSYAKK